jgi:pentatricopeptide repeat protein
MYAALSVALSLEFKFNLKLKTCGTKTRVAWKPLQNLRCNCTSNKCRAEESRNGADPPVVEKFVTREKCIDLIHQQSAESGILLAQLLSNDADVARELFADEAIAIEIGKAIVRDGGKTENALKGLYGMRPTYKVLLGAIYAFVSKSSVRGIAAVERYVVGQAHVVSQDPEEMSRFWFAIIRAYGTLGRVHEAVRVFKEHPEAWDATNARHTNIYLHALHTNIQLVFEQAQHLFDKHAVFDVITFNTLLKACMRARDGSRADQVMQWMKMHGVVPNSISWASLIKAKSYAQDFNGVLMVRESMKEYNFEPTAEVWSCLLVACGVAQQHEIALMLWREIKAALNTDSEPNSIPTDLWNAMITSCNACGQTERALTLMDEFKAKPGATPNVVTYNLAIQACRMHCSAHSEQLYHALSLYNEMRDVYNIAPDIVTYGSLMEVCAQCHQGLAALELFGRMKSDGIPANVIVMTSLLKALARSGMIDVCLQMFSKMVWGPARLRPNRVTFETLCQDLREQGALGAALRVYDGMRRAGFRPSNREFQELIAAAAEVALTNGDEELQCHVASMCRITSTSFIDLHGMSSMEARAAVLCVLGMRLTEYLGKKDSAPSSPLVIVTGKGEHSEGEPVLPKIIHHLLVDELHLPIAQGMKNDSDEGCPALTRSDAPDSGDVVNLGRLTVDGATLTSWLANRAAVRRSADAQMG